MSSTASSRSSSRVSFGQMPGLDDEPRYQMLETVREFGLERLEAAGEEDEVRERHARHFLTLAERRVRGMQLFMDLESITHGPEQDNVRLALAWFDDHDEIDALLGLSSLLYGLWFAHGLYREGLRWLERALERSSHTASAAACRPSWRRGCWPSSRATTPAPRHSVPRRGARTGAG